LNQLYSYRSSFVYGCLYQGIEITCSTNFLRGINTCLGLIILPLSAAIRELLYPGTRDANEISVLVFLYPVSAFFYTLFYTDTLSILTMLTTYYLAIRRRKLFCCTATHEFLLFLSSACAILARQTNAVWIMFIIGTEMVEYLVLHKQLPRSEDSQAVSHTELITIFVYKITDNLISIVLRFSSMLISILCFVSFVYFNGGIVVGKKYYPRYRYSVLYFFLSFYKKYLKVGDKENHRPTFHPAMLLHQVLKVLNLKSPSAIYTDDNN